MAARDDKKLSGKSRRVTRRRALGALAVGAGALLASRTARASGPLAGNAGGLAETGAQWVSWADGWAYPIVGFSEQDGSWIVEFDDGEWAIDPSGWILDSGVWYEISEIDAEGVWYFGDDGFVYLLTTDLMFPAEESLSA